MAYLDVDRRLAGKMPGANHTGSYGPGPGEKAVGEYLVSGIAFVSGSSSSDDDGNIYELNFPMLTQWFQIQNPTGGAMKIGFSAAGIAAKQFYTIPANTVSDKFEIRTKSIFIDSHGSGYSVIAGLTDIVTGSFPDYASNSTHWGT